MIAKRFQIFEKADAFKNNEKIKSRTFIEYLIKNDFINIFRVWNLEKDDASDYRDVIFNETKFFDTYKTVDFLKKEERKSYVTYREISLQIVENSDEKQYDKISIQKHVLNNLRKNVVSKSMMKKSTSSLNIFQLSTFDDTSLFESTSINIFVVVEISRFLSQKEISNKEMINLFRKNQALNKENKFFFRKKTSLCSNSSKLSNEFFEIENASLNVLSSKEINFRRNEINIVDEKRIRKSSKDFANTTWFNDKIKRIFVLWWSFSIRKR